MLKCRFGATQASPTTSVGYTDQAPEPDLAWITERFVRISQPLIRVGCFLLAERRCESPRTQTCCPKIYVERPATATAFSVLKSGNPAPRKSSKSRSLT